MIPVHKKGPVDFIGNYRPISLLSIFDKIFEKLMARRLYKFWTAHDVFYEYQFGFRPLHSTTHALTELSDFLYKSLDENYFMSGVYLDIQKAFDSVDFNILLQKLFHYGIRGNVYNWFMTFLYDRQQFVYVNNCSSDLHQVTCGVPQGSCLGPLLFLIYVNDLPNCVPSAYIRMFADDTNMFRSDCNLATLINNMQCNLAKIVDWMLANRLTLNLSKTNFTIFTPSLNSTYSLPNSITICGTNIKRVDAVKYLGILIDQSLTWKEHIACLSTKLKKLCGIFYKIRQKLPYFCLKSLYFAFVYSTVMYGVEVYANTKESYLHDLIMVNNKLLRILQFENRYCPVKILYDAYYTLPIPKLHEFKLLILVHKFITSNSQLPLVFRNYFELNSTFHTYNTRSSNDLHIVSFDKSFGFRCVKFKASKLWNSLPVNIKTLLSGAKFKGALHNHLQNVSK